MIEPNFDRKHRVGECCKLEGVGLRGLYRRIAARQFPAPDGHDGRNYWFTSTLERHRSVAVNPRAHTNLGILVREVSPR